MRVLLAGLLTERYLRGGGAGEFCCGSGNGRRRGAPDRSEATWGSPPVIMVVVWVAASSEYAVAADGKDVEIVGDDHDGHAHTSSGA